MRQIAIPALAALITASVALPANATIMTTTTPSTTAPTNGLMSTVAGVTTENFGGPLGTPPSRFAGGQVVSGSDQPFYAAPNGDISHYYIVGAPTTYTGTSTFTPGGSFNYFGLYWGSIDSFNQISFFNGTVDVGDFSGSAFPPATGNTTAANTNEYVNFFFSPGTSYTSVRFSTSTSNFEIDNVAYGNISTAVAEPGSLAVIGTGLGLMGLGLTGRRRKTGATPA